MSSFAALANNNVAKWKFHKSYTLKRDDGEDNQNSGISPSIRVLGYDDLSQSNKIEEEQEKITFKFKCPTNYRSRKGSEDICLNLTSSNPALVNSSSVLEDTKLPVFGFNKVQSNFSLNKENPTNARNSQNNLSVRGCTNLEGKHSMKSIGMKAQIGLSAKDSATNNIYQMSIAENPEEVNRYNSDISEYDENALNEL